MSLRTALGVREHRQSLVPSQLHRTSYRDYALLALLIPVGVCVALALLTGQVAKTLLTKALSD